MAPTAKTTALALAAALPALCLAAPGDATKAQGKEQLESWLEHRRLSTEAPFSAACLGACPGLQDVMNAKMEDFQALMGKYSMEASADPAVMAQMLEESTLLSLDTVCEFQEAFQCFAGHADVCKSEEAGSSTISPLFPFAFGASHMQCLCGSCPSLKAAYAKFSAVSAEVLIMSFAAAFGEKSASELASMAAEMEDKMLSGVCPVSDSMACVSANLAQCEGLFAGGGIVSMDQMVQDMMTNETAAAALKQQCDAMESADTTTVENSTEDSKTAVTVNDADSAAESADATAVENSTEDSKTTVTVDDTDSAAESADTTTVENSTEDSKTAATVNDTDSAAESADTTGVENSTEGSKTTVTVNDTDSAAESADTTAVENSTEDSKTTVTINNKDTDSAAEGSSMDIVGGTARAVLAPLALIAAAALVALA